MSRTFRLGTFIVATLTMLAIGVFLIGSRQYLFSSTYELKTTFRNVSGLNEGAEVRIGGIHQGTIDEIRLPEQPDGTMTVAMKLKKSTTKVVKTDSIASIKTEGLLGDKFIEITFGSPTAAKVSDGTTIASEAPLDMADLIKKTSVILDNVRESSEHLAQISDKIDQGRGTMGALVNDKTMYHQMNQATAEASQGAAAFHENMEALKSNFFLRGFFKDRGYEDATKLAENQIPRLPAGSYLMKFDYDAGKLFDEVDTARLKNEKALKEAGQFLESNRFGLVVIRASASMKGDAKEMETLTQARAMVVRDYLVNSFKMDDRRVKTIAAGKDPAVPNDGGLVEVIVYPANSKIPPPRISTARK